jgi:hypothetical protein
MSCWSRAEVDNSTGRRAPGGSADDLGVAREFLGLTVLVGVEVNAVLTRRAEEKRSVELVRTENPADEDA